MTQPLLALRLPSARVWTALALPLTVAALAACGGSSGDNTSNEPAAKADSSTAAAPTACATSPGNAPEDPSSLVAELPAENQAAFKDYPFEVGKTDWASLKAKTGKIKLGYSGLALTNAFGNDAVAQLKANAEKAGVDLQVVTMPNAATQSPAEQIRNFQALVRSGVDGIITIPLSGEALAPAVTAAAKQGVVTVALNGFIPSTGAINVIMNPFTQGMLANNAVINQMGGKGNLLQVQGIPGETNDAIQSAAIKEALKQCPDVKLVGTVVGTYSNPGAKAAVLKFLATHPQKIDGVVQSGTMGSGIISAFQQAGREVPTVSDAGGQLGSLAYWLDNKDKGYQGAGTGGNSFQVADASFRVMMRTLMGKGPKLRDMVIQPAEITVDNLSEFTTSGTSLNSPAQVLGTPQKLASDNYLDGFFTEPGNPDGTATVVLNK